MRERRRVVGGAQITSRTNACGNARRIEMWKLTAPLTVVWNTKIGASGKKCVPEMGIISWREKCVPFKVRRYPGKGGTSLVFQRDHLSLFVGILLKTTAPFGADRRPDLY